MKLQLRELTASDEQAFRDGLVEWQGEKPHWHSFCWKDGMSYAEMLSILSKEAAGIDLAPGRVPHTMLYAFEGEKIVGRLSVRHELNDHLRHRGGNIGYAVAPRFRRKGFATEIVRQGLEFCKNLGLDRILVTCSDDNEPSWKIIEIFGGTLENKIWDDESSETIRRYWIQLQKF